MSVEQALDAIRALQAERSQAHDALQVLIDFITADGRGIARL